MIKSYKDRISESNKILDTQKPNTKSYETYLKNNQDVIDDITKIAKWYFDYKEKLILPKKIKGIKNYIMYKGDRAVYLKNNKKESWKTNGKSTLTKILTDLVYSKIFNQDFQVFARAIKNPNKGEITAEEIQDKEDSTYSPELDAQHTSLDECQAYLDWCFMSSKIKASLGAQMRDVCAVGEGYAYIAMETSDARIQYDKEAWLKLANLKSISDEDKKAIKKELDNKAFNIVKSNAVYDYIPFSNVIYEFDKDFEDSSFVWVFSFLDIDQVLAKYDFIKLTNDQKYYILNNKSPIVWKDYNKVKLLNSMEDFISSKCDYKASDASIFFSSIADAEKSIICNWTEINKKVWECYIHWTNETITVFFNGNLIYDGPNTLGMIPINRMNKINIGGVCTSEGCTETLIDIQTSFDLISNSADDSLKTSLNPIFYTKWYANIEGIQDHLPMWDAYKIYKGDVDSIQKLDLAKFDYNILKMLDHYRQQGIMAVGLNNVSSFGDDSAQQTSGNFNKLYSLSLDVLRSTIFSVWYCLTKTYKIWSLLAQTKLPPSIRTQVTGDDGSQTDVTIKLSNILNDTDIVYQPLSVNDYAYQNLVNNFTLFSNFIAANRIDPTSNTVNYDNGAIIKQFGRAVWLKGFYQTDEQYYAKRKAAVAAEYDLEIFKAEKQQELQAKQNPQGNIGGWMIPSVNSQAHVNAVPQQWEAPVSTSQIPWLIDSIFGPSQEVATDN